MTDTAARPRAELTPERKAARERLAEITRKCDEAYATLQALAPEREKIILEEFDAGAVAAELAEVMGTSVGRVYKLRDNGKKRAAK
jgi:DNA-directed RNA polymerase specialized sigma24 family protein